MTIAIGRFTLDPSALPWRSDDLGVGISMGVGNNKKPLLLIHPGADRAFEPQHIRYAADITLELDDDTVHQLGQLVVTGERIIGMITRGSAGGAKLGPSLDLRVYTFALTLNDIEPIEVTTNRKGVPAEALIRSRAGQLPPFALRVSSVVGCLSDAGVLTYRSSLRDLIDSLTPESRENLRKPSLTS